VGVLFHPQNDPDCPRTHLPEPTGYPKNLKK
jgi:hypothetical protein